MSKINIGFTVTDNYAQHLAATMASILSNTSKDNELNFFVLNEGDITSETKRRINQLSNIREFNIKYVTVKREDFSEYSPGVHMSTNYRLKVASLIPEVDKILFLDVDLIVLDDIANLWNTDISGVYAAVVKDVFSITNRDYMNNLGIRHEFYFNSGVMLLNLAKMRDDKIPEKLLEFRMTHDQVFMDQDAFNAVIGNNVLYLPWWYNFLNCYLEYASPQQLSDLFTDDFNKSPVSIFNQSTILHLGGAAKPWMQDMGYLSKLYKRYYKRSNCKKYPLSFGKRHHSLWWHLRHWKF